MLTCGTCRERCIKALLGTSILSTSIRPSTVSKRQDESLSRSYHKNSRARKRSRRPDEDVSPQYRPSKPWLTVRPYMVDAEEFRRQRQEGVDEPIKIRTRELKLQKSMETVLQKHPAYLSDPLKLGDFVRKSLRGDDFDTAVAIVRAASKKMQCTVSWNHLMDWQLSKGRMNAALKTYNEMKKRGQSPDAHTFTIIISGCTHHKDVKAALSKVIAIFQNMQTDRSPVKPNTIHLNAILKMCAKAKDMEAMFAVVSHMPAKGVSAPNNLTFTTIINALAKNTYIGSIRKSLVQVQHTQKTILDARQIWRDVSKRWLLGDLWIDEELVCAMGRLLLQGDHQDKDDILSLIEQTMNIPRQVPRMYQAGSQVKDGGTRTMGVLKAPSKEIIEPAEESGAQVSEDFLASTPPSVPARAKEHGVLSAYAKPGRNSLSMVLSALIDRPESKTATDKYWKIFVDDIGVKPDIENYHTYLRILRYFRASSQTVELLQTIDRTEMRVATFRIAMASCERDKRNPHAFANSGKILDLMKSSLSVPDITVLATYLDVATAATLESNLSRLEQGKQILRALERLIPSYLDIKATLLYGDEISERTRMHNEYRDSVLLLVQRMIAAYNVLMDKGLVDRSKYSELTAERSKLNAFLSRQKSQQDVVEDHQLPPHLLARVHKHHLNGIMAKAQAHPIRWRTFVERLTTDYEADQKRLAAAKEMQQESLARSQKVEKVTEDEGQPARKFSNRVFPNSIPRSGGQRANYNV